MYAIVMENSTIEEFSDRAVVRPAAEDDLDQVAAIYEPYVLSTAITFDLEPPSLEEWRRRYGAISRDGLPFLVVQRDDEVAGYAYCSRWKSKPAYRRTVEDSIYLATDRRGQGLGGRLLDRLLTEVAARGIREVISVIADTGDAASIALHASRGFAEVGRLRHVGHKFDRWVDTVLMQRSLGA